MLNNWWLATGGKSSLIPRGIIMPYTEDVSNIPAGWHQYRAGEGAVMGGAVAKVTGGSNLVGVSAAVVGHYGPPFNQTSATGARGTIAAAWKHFNNHSHSATITRTENRHHFVFIKADLEHAEFPEHTGFLGDTDFSGYGLYNRADSAMERLLFFTQKATPHKAAAAHKVGMSSTAPNHNHANIHYTQTTLQNVTSGPAHAAGKHRHSVSIRALTANVKRYYMGLWTAASGAMKLNPGFYGLWDMATAPDGWVFCDGQNNTPNLHDSTYIALTQDNVKMGTLVGDNTISTRTQYGGGGGHGHRGVDNSPKGNTGCFHQTTKAHGHSGSNTGAYQPPFFTVKFIKFVG
jgi:hypothetical protein